MLLIALALALAPIAAIIIYFYQRDKYDREPTALLIRAFVYGVLSIVPAFLGSWLGTALGFEISPNIFITFVYAFFVVALSEEFAKFLFLRFGLFPNKDFNEPYDGILYSVMVSMGFAATENILYVYEGGISLALLRMFTAVPAHATFATIMGYYTGLSKFIPQRRSEFLLKGLGGAVFMHGLYDFFLMQMNYEGMAFGAIGSLIVSIIYSKKAVRIQVENSPFNPKNQPPLPPNDIPPPYISTKEDNNNTICTDTDNQYNSLHTTELPLPTDDCSLSNTSIPALPDPYHLAASDEALTDQAHTQDLPITPTTQQPNRPPVL